MFRTFTADRLSHAKKFGLVAIVLSGLVLSGCGLAQTPTEMNISKELEAKLNKLPAPVRPPEPTNLPQMAERMLRRNTIQDSVADALARIGPDAVPSLVQALQSPDSERRENAARALARMGSRASDAVPALIAALHDPDEDVRQNAIRALGQIGSGAKDAIPELISMLGRDGSQPSLGRQPVFTTPAVPVTTPVPANTRLPEPESSPRFPEPSTTTPRYPEHSTTTPRYPEPSTSAPSSTTPRYSEPAKPAAKPAEKSDGPKLDTSPGFIPQTLPVETPESRPKMPPSIPPPTR